MSDSKQSETKRELVFRGPDHCSPYPTSRLAPAFDAAVAAQNLAQELERAEHLLGTVAQGKLDLILGQIQQLQAQAHTIVQEAREDLDLHRVECRFAREVGGVYHLYRRADSSCYFSMLSPQDWGERMPHQHEGSYRLRADMRYEKLGAG